MSRCPNETILDIECESRAKRAGISYTIYRERVRWLMHTGLPEPDALTEADRHFKNWRIQ